MYLPKALFYYVTNNFMYLSGIYVRLVEESEFRTPTYRYTVDFSKM